LISLITDVTQKLKNSHAEQGAEVIFLSSFDASRQTTSGFAQDDYRVLRRVEAYLRQKKPPA
jgi:hypothetical protein